MCQILSETELQIQEIMEENRKQKRNLPNCLPFQESDESIEENCEIVTKMNSVWNELPIAP